MGGASATENAAKCFGTSSEEIDAAADVRRPLSFSKIDCANFLGKIQNLMLLRFIKTRTWTLLPHSLAPLCRCRGENSQFFSKTILLFPSSLFLELCAKFQMEVLQQGLVGGSSVIEEKICL